MVNRTPAAMRLLLAVSAWAFAMPGFAQTSTASLPTPVDDVEQSYAPEPAHVAYLDGSAVVTRDGRADPATINVPLVSGDQVRTRAGRVEVLFGDGSVLDIDQFTSLDFLSDQLVRLTEGRIRVTIGGRDRVSYRVDTPSGAVRIEAPGGYRISLIGESGRRDVELVTTRGYATLVNELGETGVRAGERAFATEAMAPSYAQAYNSAAWDAFDSWAEARHDERTGVTSAQYLPDEIRGYAGDFDRYGAWQYDVSYGYVWYPRVRVDWRPYSYGRWNYYGPWGWTWIAYDRWGWPTHHYGRWGLRAGVWFWIPSRHWAPAYVYWAGASDYVGWCPLGWDNRPIFSIINVNIGRGYRGYDPYRAWTVVPRRAFGSHVDVGRYAVARGEIDRAVPRWYVSGASAPIRPALATRHVTPIYSAGRSARSSARPSGGEIGRGRAGARSAEAGAPRDYSAPRAYRSAVPNGNVRRATPPAAAGALGSPGNWQSPDARRGRADTRGAGAGGQGPGVRGRMPEATSRQAPSGGDRTMRAPYRDAGPGGPEPRYQPQTGVDRAPSRGVYGRSPSEDGRVGAPRGVPQGGISGPRGVPRNEDRPVYAPRGVPRGGGVYAPAPRGAEPPTTYSAPSRPSRGRPEGYGGGVYAPRPSPERPSYSQPPSSPGPSRSAPAAGRPSGGENRGRERATPRGGGSGQSARPSGGHSRRPQ